MTNQQDQEYLGVQMEKPLPLLKIEEDNPASMTPQQNESLQRLLTKYNDVFSSDLSTLGRTDLITCRIDLNEEKAAKTPLKQQPWSQRHNDEFIKEDIERMLKYDIIEPARSPYGANLVVVGKKNGKKRTCSNYQPLNRYTIPNHYPFPRAEELLITLTMPNGFLLSILPLDFGKYLWMNSIKKR